MAPRYEATSRLVARALGLAVPQLLAALRPATLADLGRIVAFRAAALGPTIQWDDAGYLAWRYRLGRPEAGFGELFILQPGDEPLAILGVEMLPCTLDGEFLEGARVMDLLARSDLQGSGIGVWLNQTMSQRHTFALAMGANQNSEGIVRRLYEPLPERQTYTHPIDCHPFLRRSVNSAIGRGVAGTAANVTMSSWRLWRRVASPAGVRVEPVSRFEPQHLPGVTAKTGQLRLLRNAEPLNRRLFDNPRRRYEAAVARCQDRTIGYLAWLTDEMSGERPELVVSDWQASSATALGALLMAAIGHAGNTGCACVRLTLQDEATRRVAKRHGFLRLRNGSSHLVGVRSEDAALQARLAAADWALTDISDDLDGF